MRSGLVMVIGLYRRWLSPLKPACCRYIPTCSDYAQQALTSHGVRAGGLLVVRRVCRCHPWGGSGYDPVPPAQR
jgi:putative membrane protein insertion efficiency factor